MQMQRKKPTNPEPRSLKAFSSLLAYQKLNLLSLICGVSAVYGIILLDVGLNGVVESGVI